MIVTEFLPSIDLYYAAAFVIIFPVVIYALISGAMRIF